MKIVFVGPFGLKPKGTMSVRALPLAKSLAGRGHSVTVLIPPWDDPESAGQVWNDEGVRVVNTSLPLGIPLLFHILLTRTLAAYVLAEKPDIVHFFKPKAYAGLTHLVLYWLRSFGALSSRLVLDADDWEQAWNALLPYSRVQKGLFTWQERWGLQHADAVTAASRELEKLAARTRGSASQIFYVPNGFLPKAAPKAESGVALREMWQLGQAPVILLYSRFAEFRLERIVTLVKRVAAQLPKARWLFVGQGLYGEDEQLATQLAQNGLTDHVRFTGWPVDNLSACFATANVAVHPYDDRLINRTKCSVKLIELLMAGLPVVADAVGQNSEYIQDNVSGLLVSAEDDDAFAEALICLLQSPEKQRRLGQAASEYVRHHFDWTKLSQGVERAYR